MDLATAVTVGLAIFAGVMFALGFRSGNAWQ